MQADLEEFFIAALGWIPTRVGMALRLAIWKWLFAQCGMVRFGTNLVLQGCANMRLADRVRIGHACQLYAKNGVLEIGTESAMSPGVIIDASDGLICLGKHVAVGPGTVIRAANHNFACRDIAIMHQGHRYGRILVEDDVWIAANCTLTPCIKIGRGAIIGAGAVVTHDVAPFSIVGGVPAKIIGHR